MTAEEANDLTKKSLKNLSKRALSDILKRIEEAAYEGKYLVRINVQAMESKLIEGIVKFYKFQGYSVYHSKSTSTLILSWRNPMDSKA